MKIFDHPVAIIAFAEAVLALVISFGLDLTVEQVGGIITVVSTGLALFAVSRGRAVKDLPVGD